MAWECLHFQVFIQIYEFPFLVLESLKQKNMFKRLHKEDRNSRIARLIFREEGSLSILIIALFLIALISLAIITNVAVVANAKRSLDQVTEAAAMRAIHNLDERSYYSGKHTILNSIANLASAGNYSDNRIPIDCELGKQAVFEEFRVWESSVSKMKTLQIESANIDRYQCQYDWVNLQTSATVKLPFAIPFTGRENATVESSITTLNEKDKGFYLFGVRLR